MIDNTIFYFKTIRKTVVAFGTLFNAIHINRVDKDGNPVQLLKVPLSYGPKQKFLMRIRQDPDLSTRHRVEMTVPRLGFEILNMNYEASRAMAPTTQLPHVTGGTLLNQQFVPVPYNLSMALYVLVKNQDDGLQILEQILPFFKPDYVITVKDVPEMGNERATPITLQNISYEDDYKGDFSVRTSIIWTLVFNVKIMMYPPVSQQGQIKQVIATVYPNMPGMTTENDVYTATVNPESANPTDDYTIIEEWEHNFD
jgi:hypothetical protein